MNCMNLSWYDYDALPNGIPFYYSWGVGFYQIMLLSYSTEQALKIHSRWNSYRTSVEDSRWKLRLTYYLKRKFISFYENIFISFFRQVNQDAREI